MKKLFILIILLLQCSVDVLAQSTIPDSPKYLIPLIAKVNPDTNKIALLNKLGGFYIFKKGNFKYDLDSALVYLNDALSLSAKLNSIVWKNKTLKLKGDCFLEGEDLVNGKACFKQVTDYYHSIGDISAEAETWARLGRCYTWGHYAEKEFCFTRAVYLYSQLKIHNRLKEIHLRKDLADAHLNAGKLDLAEIELKQVISDYKAIGYKRLEYSYDLLADVYHLKGFPNKELASCLECIKHLKISGDTVSSMRIYYRIGTIYQRLGYYDESVAYLQMAVDRAAPSQTVVYDHSLFLRDLSEALRKQGKVYSALNLLLKNFKHPQTMSAFERCYIEEGIAGCYRQLKSYAKAEKYYLDMLKDSKTKENGTTDLDLWSQEILLCELYVEMRQFGKAEFFFSDIGSFPSGLISAIDLGRIQLIHFKIDSAKGLYVSAIQHFEKYKILNDSIFNERKSKQLQELEINYETAEKEKSIIDLKSRGKEQQEKLISLNLQRNLTLAGTGLLLLIAGLAYNGFRQKRRINLTLQIHQNEIDKKNASLELLNSNQQSLLTEKEWLLKEIHHRVKNNLQTTISLLNMQSVYLSNDDALAAIRNSQRRMQAMSLIHQKLYLSETMTHVQMYDYVTDLVAFLKESFKGSKDINYKLKIQPIMLEITQAIPLGLIINEAITNSIKYAFTDRAGGVIAICLQIDVHGNAVLKIADNGVGIPDCFKVDEQFNSLGLNLIRGLTNQLNGQLTITNEQGTLLCLSFKNAGVEKKGAMQNIDCETTTS